MCPASNRDGSGVANDSTLFAPILVGDHIAAAQGCNLLAVVATPNLPTPDPSEVPPEVVAAVVEVDRAKFEPGKDEWRIDGVTDIPFEVITIYLGDHTVAGAPVIGQTTAGDIGAFSVRARDSAVSSNGGFVSAVSDNTGGFGIAGIDIK